MPWIKAKFKDAEVWVEVDERGQLRADSGRVPMRYSDAPDARIYRAGTSRLDFTAASAPRELPAGRSADDESPKAETTPRAPPKKSGNRLPTSGFGKAGTRTVAQAANAKAAAGTLVASFAPDSPVCFTDGACKGNPGPCGAGAVVKLPDGQHLERFQALGIGTNNVGELSAVGLALDLLDQAGVDPAQRVELLTDSKYAHGVLSLGWKAKANTELIVGLRKRLAQRKVRMHWVAGHVGIPENERADALANLGVADSASGRRGVR